MGIIVGWLCVHLGIHKVGDLKYECGFEGSFQCPLCSFTELKKTISMFVDFAGNKPWTSVLEYVSRGYCQNLCSWNANGSKEAFLCPHTFRKLTIYIHLHTTLPSSPPSFPTPKLLTPIHCIIFLGFIVFTRHLCCFFIFCSGVVIAEGILGNDKIFENHGNISLKMYLLWMSII